MMPQDTVEKIQKLNEGFYKTVAEDFSATRSYPWKGWGKAVEIIGENFRGKEVIKVLDLGCGNGRFYKYISEKLPTEKINYLGIDSNTKLIKEAKILYYKADFQKKDFLNLGGIKEKYDVVAGFGITHHIPSRELRKKWLLKLPNLLIDKGLLILTFSHFVETKKKNKVYKEILNGNITISSEELEKEDFFLGWGSEKNVYRYCHNFTPKEITTISILLNINLIEKYKSDGKNSKSNTYMIWKNN